MALNPYYFDVLVNAAADGIAALFNSGIIRFYDGTQPSNGGAITTQVLLAEVTLGSTAFGAAVAGVITANTFTQDSSANNTGTATWYRTFKSDGTTPLDDGSIGTSSSNINMVTTSITSGQPVQITAYTITVNKT